VHQKLASEFEANSAALSEAEVLTERLKGNARAAMTELASVEAEDRAYKQKETQLKTKRSERLYLSALSEAFDRLRIDLDNRTRPELEASASELISEMTDGRYSAIEINDSYQATIQDDGEAKPVISGGEDDVVNLALRLAISQMIAERAGQPFSLLILDEVFGSLDESRRGNVVDMLLNLKNRFRQIIVITHIESIYDMVDNCIWVDYDEQKKISRIVERRPDVLTYDQEEMN
jgi:DNA repair protein SbcC/Rad50